MTYNNLIIISPDKVIRDPHTGCTGKYEDDWAFCKRGKDMAALGFNNYTILIGSMFIDDIQKEEYTTKILTSKYFTTKI